VTRWSLFSRQSRGLLGRRGDSALHASGKLLRVLDHAHRKGNIAAAQVFTITWNRLLGQWNVAGQALGIERRGQDGCKSLALRLRPQPLDDPLDGGTAVGRCCLDQPVGARQTEACRTKRTEQRSCREVILDKPSASKCHT
jgi:hypothetical protein